MSALVSVLKFLYPEADLERDILLQDDGSGAYIKAWKLETPPPTQAEIEAAMEQSAAVQARERIMAQIDALERDALQNRGDRELALINMQDLARRKVEAYLEANPDDPTPAADLIQHELETTPYWVKLTELNAQIAVLRAQL
jgi:hypothetical protein